MRDGMTVGELREALADYPDYRKVAVRAGRDGKRRTVERAEEECVGSDYTVTLFGGDTR